MKSMKLTLSGLLTAVAFFATGTIASAESYTVKSGDTLSEIAKEKNTSVLCKELKGITTGTVLRSCRGCVEDAAEILEEIVKKKMN